MKILLATPIYPPEIGGPSVYVQELEERFAKKGIKTKVVSYNNLKTLPKFFRLFVYCIKLFLESGDCDLIYCFNQISCGAPSYLASRLRRKCFFIRLGGDFLWERAVESGRTSKTLRDYYKEPKTLKEKFWIFVIKKILDSAKAVIFTSGFQKEIYKKHYNLKNNKIIVIPNPFPDYCSGNRLSDTTSQYYQLLYAGRLIKLKNLDVLIEAFSEVLRESKKPLSLKIIGAGPQESYLREKIKKLKLKNNVFIHQPISHNKLLKEIQGAYLSVLPSLTDITPNFALDCLKLGTPILLTKETEYFRKFYHSLIFIDPCDAQDIKNKLLFLLDRANYINYIEKIKKIPVSYSWQDVIQKHISLFKETEL